MKFKFMLIAAAAGAAWAAPAAFAENCWYAESSRQPHHVILTPNTDVCYGTEVQLVTQGDEVANLTAELGEAPIVTISLKCREGYEFVAENYALTSRTSYFPYPSGCTAKNFARVSTVNFLPSQIAGKLKIRLKE